jgi:hypothetical protein
MDPKRIVSYSLFGTGEDYRRGALDNAALVRAIFPGWTCRIHVSDLVSPDVADALRAQGAEVVVMPQRAAYDGLFWRFLPADEPDLDAMIVRDADARLSQREKAAVDEWLASGKALHIIRDHPNHRRLIPAGLWGCRGGAIPDMPALVEQFGRTHGFDSRLGDADFLERFVYLRFRGNTFLHSEFVHYPGEVPHIIAHPRDGDEYLGCPAGRDGLRQRRLEDFARSRGQGPTLRALPDWMKQDV